MPGEPSQQPPELQNLVQRIDQLERENERLRQKLEPIVGPDNPCFDPHLFCRILTTRIMLLMLPLYLMMLMPAASVLLQRRLPAGYIAAPRLSISPVPVFDFAGQGTRHLGLGAGIIAFGGAAIGVVAIGGLGVGLIALGGGAVGVVACGGGALGIIAIGGGAVGVIAIGGGATGYYALGQRGHGRYVLALNRQDPEAIAFFTRCIPSLRRALTNPMPVIPLADRPPRPLDKT